MENSKNKSKNNLAKLKDLKNQFGELSHAYQQKFWRYGLNLSSQPLTHPKTQLPMSVGGDPDMWIDLVKLIDLQNEIDALNTTLFRCIGAVSRLMRDYDQKLYITPNDLKNLRFYQLHQINVRVNGHLLHQYGFKDSLSENVGSKIFDEVGDFLGIYLEVREVFASEFDYVFYFSLPNIP